MNVECLVAAAWGSQAGPSMIICGLLGAHNESLKDDSGDVVACPYKGITLPDSAWRAPELAPEDPDVLEMLALLND